MLKLLQEVQGLNQFGSRQTPRTDVLFLPVRHPFTPQKRKQIIRIRIQEPTDIPTPVEIVFLQAAPGRI